MMSLAATRNITSKTTEMAPYVFYYCLKWSRKALYSLSVFSKTIRLEFDVAGCDRKRYLEYCIKSAVFFCLYSKGDTTMVSCSLSITYFVSSQIVYNRIDVSLCTPSSAYIVTTGFVPLCSKRRVRNIMFFVVVWTFLQNSHPCNSCCSRRVSRTTWQWPYVLLKITSRRRMFVLCQSCRAALYVLSQTSCQSGYEIFSSLLESKDIDCPLMWLSQSLYIAIFSFLSLSP